MMSEVSFRFLKLQVGQAFIKITNVPFNETFSLRNINGTFASLKKLKRVGGRRLVCATFLWPVKRDSREMATSQAAPKQVKLLEVQWHHLET